MGLLRGFRGSVLSFLKRLIRENKPLSSSLVAVASAAIVAGSTSAGGSKVLRKSKSTQPPLPGLLGAEMISREHT